jgi:hypothetical protein
MRLSVHKRENQYIKLHILYRVASASFLTLSSPKERHPVWASDRKPAAVVADDQRRVDPASTYRFGRGRMRCIETFAVIGEGSYKVLERSVNIM